MKKTKKYIESGITLGVGSTVLGAMGQGVITTKVVTPAANMMSPMIAADYGMSIMDMANKYNKDKKPVKMKKGKHIGYGEWL